MAFLIIRIKICPNRNSFFCLFLGDWPTLQAHTNIFYNVNFIIKSILFSYLYDVPARKGRRDAQSDTGYNKVITKFFVSNLPPKCSSVDLKDVFRRYRDFEASYIARKRDRWGKRFGFISFQNVTDVKRLEGEMGDVWMGLYKLFIGLASVDGEKVQGPKVDATDKRNTRKEDFHAKTYAGGEAQRVVNQVSENATLEGGIGRRSFLDTVLNRKHGGEKVDVINIVDNVEGFSSWQGYSLVGRVVDFKTLTGLKECNRFLEDTDVWKDFFGSLRRWNGDQKLEEERIAWLQVYGVPVHLAVDQVFDVIGSRHGQVVQPACMTEENCNFSYAYIGVLCKTHARIRDRSLEDSDAEVESLEKEDNVRFDDCRPEAENQHDVSGDSPTDLEIGEIHSDDIPSQNTNTASGEHIKKVAETSNLYNKELPNISGSTSVRKKYRRRSSIKKVGESNGPHERPKKRLREDSDPFGLDKFIGILSNSPVLSVGEEPESGSPVGYCTPDLNQQIGDGEPGGVGSNCSKGSVWNDVVTGVPAGSQEVDHVINEVAATVELGRTLGAENLDDFLPMLKRWSGMKGFKWVANERFIDEY
ncbi:putative RNA recognition motif domain, nucleotide-binding alpha-beta plait domain superfamily [Helianthus anomalus]